VNIVVEFWWMKPWFKRLQRFNPKNSPIFITRIFKKVNLRFGLAFFLFLIFSFPSQAYLQFDSNSIQAYSSLWNLELGKSRKLIDLEKVKAPNNHIIALLENYQAFFKVFTDESPENYQNFKTQCSQDLETLESESKTNSPLFLYSKSCIHLESAIIRAKFQDYWSAAFELRRSFFEIQQNKTRFPNFNPNDTYLGIIESLLGSLPNSLKFILGPLGLKGNVNQGLNELEKNMVSLRKGPFSFLYPETSLYYTYLSASLEPSQKTYQELIGDNNFIEERSLVKTYVNAWIALKKYQNEAAIQLLKSRPFGADYQNFPFLDYLLGIAYLNKLDPEAIPYLQKFLKNSANRNFKWDTYLKLSWAYSLSGKNELAKEYFSHIPYWGQDPSTEKDKQALREYAQGIPNKSLLEIRLQFDGGYWISCLDRINQIDSTKLITLKERLEFVYRKARIFEGLEKYPSSIFFHQKCVELGSNSPYYFSANSSLHLGLIYEKLHKDHLAKTSFENCLKMNEKEFKSSIDQEAQNGINRLKK